VRAADGIDSLRAALALLFDRFEIGRAPVERRELEAEGEALPADGFDDGDVVPMLELGKWTVALYPREEWQGDLDGYWQEIVGRVPLTINEQGSTLADY
jgi:hypothetical protein